MKKSLLFLSVMFLLLNCGTMKTTPATDTVSETLNIKDVDPTAYGTTITAAELKEMLYVYASDEFEGRNTGDKGQKMAVEYLKKKYITMGIPSALPNNDYFQEVPLEKQKSPEVTLNLNGQDFQKNEHFITYGSSTSQKFDANEIIYVGYGIDSEGYSDYSNLDVKGKIVVAREGEPKNSEGIYTISGTTESSKWSNGRQALTSKRDVAKDKGARSLFLMDSAMFNRFLPFYKSQDESDSAGRISLENNIPEMITFLISNTMGKALFKDIEENTKPQIITSKIAVDVISRSEKLTSENVAAFIKGYEKPNEILVISAHLDHEGIKNGEIYNGADDDGSGTVAILEIAQAFKKAVDDGYTPKRSILFLHVTGEEKGLLGSRYYTDFDPIFPLENTIADLNIDMIGRIDKKHENNGNYVYLIGSDKLSTELHNLSEEVNKKYINMEFDYTYNDENDPNRYYYRSDHYNFAKNNVPVIFYFNGTHDDYHKPSDTPDKIEYDLLENRTRLVFYTAWELANRDQRITVDKVTE
ncbi:MAG: M28 family metallopeptidase [Aquaticitalea sp.]